MLLCTISQSEGIPSSRDQRSITSGLSWSCNSAFSAASFSSSSYIPDPLSFFQTMAMEKPERGRKTITSVPVIDLSGLSDPIKRSLICAQVAEASETLGFFQIVNTSLPVEVLEDGLAANQEFFKLPLEEKLNPRIETVNLDKKRKVLFQLGYRHNPIQHNATHRKEEMVFRHYHLKPKDRPEDTHTIGYEGPVDSSKNWWPANPPNYREKVERLQSEFGKLVDELLDIFSESLGLPATFLRLTQHRNATVPRYVHFHHYPKSTKPEIGDTGLTAHRDSSIFTLLCQCDGQKGLEINPDGEWISVMPQRGGVIINVGDILQAWSNGRYKSMLHRVICNHDTGRVSCAYFCLPADFSETNFIVKPIEALVTKDKPAKFVPFSYRDFFLAKMQKNSVSHLRSLEV